MPPTLISLKNDQKDVFYSEGTTRFQGSCHTAKQRCILNVEYLRNFVGADFYLYLFPFLSLGFSDISFVKLCFCTWGQSQLQTKQIYRNSTNQHHEPFPSQNLALQYLTSNQNVYIEGKKPT